MATSLALRSLARGSVLSHRRAAVAGLRSLHASSSRSKEYAGATLDTFNQVVGAKDRLVLVDFYADWCRPCHMLSPVLTKFATDASFKSSSGLPIDVVKIDTEKEELFPIVQKHRITNLPTVIAFHNGEPTGKFIGALNEGGVTQFLQGLPV